MFVDVRDKVKRLELVEFLEQEGFAFDKERIVNSVLPVILNFVDKTADRCDDLESAYEAIKRKKQKALTSSMIVIKTEGSD